MVNQVLKAKDGAVAFDIGTTRPDGGYAIASFDEDTFDALQAIVTELQDKLEEGGTVSLSPATLASLESVTAIITGEVTVTDLQTDSLTNVELRASDVEVNDDAAQALLTSIEGALGDTVTADTVRELLFRIYEAVDGLELSVDNIDINTDGVETELSTLNAVDFATQTTLEAARVLLDSINIELVTQQKDALTDVELRASEIQVNDDDAQAALATLLTESTFAAEDFATQETLEAARALLLTIDADTSVLATTDFSTEATLATLLTDATFTAEDFATQNTLEAARVLLVSIDTELATQQKDALTNVELRASDVEVNDDAAQALLSAIENALGDTVTADTVREILLRIYGAVDGLELSAENIYVNVDEVEAELATLNAVDFATQNTLEAARVLLASLDGKDYSTESTLEAARTLMTDVKRSVTDFETQLDYDVRNDGNPVYVGKASQGALTASAVWVIQKLEYDVINRLIRVQVKDSIAWDDRAVSF
jgi:hypothetical protein